MISTYDFNPDVHVIIDPPVVQKYREAQPKLSNVVGVHHLDTGTYTLTIRSDDGGQLGDLDFLDGGDGTSIMPDRHGFQRVVARLKSWQHPDELKKKVVEDQRARLRDEIDARGQYADAQMGLAHELHRQGKSGRAEKHLRNTRIGDAHKPVFAT